MTICSAWATESDLCAPCLTDSYTLNPDRLDAKLLEASDVMYQLTMQQFPGTCEATVTPCSRRHWDRLMQAGFTARWPNTGLFLGFPGCSCHNPASCTCTSQDAIELPADHIQGVSEVRTSDGSLDYTSYELHGNELVRTDGGHWPCCDDAFEIDFTYGLAPPPICVTAAAVLGCELYLACYPDDVDGATCRLPRNISSIARQGVSVIFASLTRQSLQQPFRFGIWEIDLALETYAPYGQRSMSVIASPDTVPTSRAVT
jgi:hypothetical protein